MNPVLSSSPHSALPAPSLEHAPLPCNKQMIAGMIVGFMVAAVVVTLLVSALIASQGTLLFGLIAIKMISVALSTTMANLASGLVLLSFYLGGGYAAGALLHKGRIAQMDRHFTPLQRAIAQISGKVLGSALPEAKLEAFVFQREGSLFSSRIAKHMRKLSYHQHLSIRWKGQSVGGIVCNLIKCIAFLGSSCPYTYLHSLCTDSAQYAQTIDLHLKERELKTLSADNSLAASKALEELNALRAVQLSQMTLRMDAVNEAYSKVPELAIFERYQNKLLCLRALVQEQPTPDTELLAQIQTHLSSIQEERLKLLQERSEEHVLNPADTGIRSFFTIEEDILKLDGLSAEHRGQILEALQILMLKNNALSLKEINGFVLYIADKLKKQALEGHYPHWHTRHAVLQYASSYKEGKAGQQLQTFSSSETTPSFYSPSYLQRGIWALKALDILSVVFYTAPIPGGSVMALLCNRATLAVQNSLPANLFLKSI